MEEAKAAILAIVDPPKAELGKTYSGRVVNITKFGAFVNILPGRDGLLHISKLGRGKRVERVEDVVSLGSDITVRVDDIDPQGKVALSPVGDDNGDAAPSSAPAAADAPSDGREFVSFEDQFEAQAKERFGDLGPAETSGARAGGSGGGDQPRRNRDRDRRRSR